MGTFRGCGAGEGGASSHLKNGKIITHIIKNLTKIRK